MSDPTPSHGAVTGLDHAGFIVADLAASATLMAQLGFRLTVRADHTRTNSDGETVSAGSAQHSLMFRRGYIELMQITDPAAGHQLTPAMRVRFGLHVLALGSDDAAQCHARCQRDGIAVGPLLNWARPVREGSCQGMARFCYFDARWDPHDPSYVCWVQHMTPDLMRPAHLLVHDNGALALRGVHYRGPQAMLSAWARQLALAAGVEAAPGVVRVADAHFALEADERLSAVVPSALELDFDDLTVVRALCARHGIGMQDRPDGVLDIDLTRQLGLHLLCRRETA